MDSPDALASGRSRHCLVHSDTQAATSAQALTAPFTYLRLHGSRRLYASNTPLPRHRAGRRRSVRNLPAYVYFDNDYMAYAVKNALEMRSSAGTGNTEGVASAAYQEREGTRWSASAQSALRCSLKKNRPFLHGLAFLVRLFIFEHVDEGSSACRPCARA